MKEVAEKIPNEDRSLMIGHPQRNTHSAHMKRENHLVVPNFLPNTLPDQTMEIENIIVAPC